MGIHEFCGRLATTPLLATPLAFSKCEKDPGNPESDNENEQITTVTYAPTPAATASGATPTAPAATATRTAASANCPAVGSTAQLARNAVGLGINITFFWRRQPGAHDGPLAPATSTRT